MVNLLRVLLPTAFRTAGVLAQITAAIDGLTYPSDADELCDVIDWPPGAMLTKTDGAARFAELREVMSRTLTGIAVVRVVEDVTINVFVLGRTSIGHWAGVHTLSVET